jgi:hypothetical protein
MWHGYAVMIRRGLAEQLTKLRGADRVVLLAPGASLPNGMTISGELTEFEKGDIALRWIIGFGAGRRVRPADSRLLIRLASSSLGLRHRRHILVGLAWVALISWTRMILRVSSVKRQGMRSMVGLRMGRCPHTKRTESRQFDFREETGEPYAHRGFGEIGGALAASGMRV